MQRWKVSEAEMTEREKILKDFADYEPYALNLPSITMISRHYLNVLELLKEKKPVKPKTDNIRRFLCGSCEAIIGQGQNYCGKCGKQVDWKK